MRSSANILFCIMFFICVTNASGHEAETLFNQVHVQAQVEKDIPNDEMQSLLVSEQQGKNASDLSRLVNEDVKWAINIAKKIKTLKSARVRIKPIQFIKTVMLWDGVSVRKYY